MTTSIPANASSPANISPVGPPPAITTACSVIAAPLDRQASLEDGSVDPVDDVGGQRRRGHLDGLCLQLRHIVEQPLSASEHDRDDVEYELIEAAGLQRLADRART